MSNKEVRAVLSQELYDHVEASAKAAGVTKAKWVAYLISQDIKNPRASEVNCDRIQGVKAKSISLVNSDQKVWLLEQEQVLWYEGYLWFVGRTPNGSQVALDRWLELPYELFSCMGNSYRKSAKEVVAALERWHELKAIELIDVVTRSAGCIKPVSFFDSGREFFDGDDFKELKAEALKAIEQYKLSIAEPTAVVEVVNDEIAIEVVIDAPSPLNEVVEEPTTLTRDAFRTKFGLTDDGAYGKARTLGEGDGYLADGHLWFVTGRSKKAVWSNAPVVARQLELALA